MIIDMDNYKLKVFSPRNNLIGRALYQHGIWEPEVTSCVTEETRLGMIALDVGADIGYYSLHMSRLVGSQGRVIAFEPIPEARRRLAYNVSINQCANVTISEYALGNQEGPVYLEDPFNQSRLNLTKTAADTKDINVFIKRLDDLIGELGLSSVDVVKIDVEGAEHEVLKGMQHTLCAYHPVLIIEVHNKLLPLFDSSSEELLNWVSDLGYHISLVDGEPSGDLNFTQTVCCRYNHRNS